RGSAVSAAARPRPLRPRDARRLPGGAAPLHARGTRRVGGRSVSDVDIGALGAAAMRDRVSARELGAEAAVAASLAAVERTRGGAGGLNYMLWSDPDAALA